MKRNFKRAVPEGMERLQKHQHILLNFPKFSNNQQKWCKENISLDFCKVIVEICHNLNNGNLPSNKRIDRELKPYKRRMQTLTTRHMPLGQRKHIIQRGGFLSILLSAIGSALISHLLSKV